MRFRMNGVDYTQRLSRQRELFQRDLESANRSHETALEDIQAAKESQLKENSKNFSDNKLKLEKAYEDRYENLQTSQKEALKEKNKAYEESLHKEQVKNSAQTREKVKNWEQKIDDIKRSYDHNLSDTKRMDKQIRAQVKETADARVKSVLSDS
ncbi:MAG: hypothetical protein CME67_06460 [Halobacteriovoraceae bacterium]|nr:hypothetical protein [Halobacteriovoraceae bacterium]